MKTYLKLSMISIALLMASTNNVVGQENKSEYKIEFRKENLNDTIHRLESTETIWTGIVKTNNVNQDNLKDHVLSIEIDKEKSTLPEEHYEIITQIKDISFSKLNNEQTIRISIKKDDPNFKQTNTLKLVLKIKITDSKKNQVTHDFENAVLNVYPTTQPLREYRYLGYIGTNFDLVDGVKPKNLFFATHILITTPKKWGFNLGLYGNRSITRTDTLKETSFLSRTDRLNDSTIIRSFDSASQVRTFSSDNIGAFFAPLFKIKSLSHGDLNLYYAPHFEFIWRRTTLEDKYQNNRTIRTDTSKNRFSPNTPFPIISPTSRKEEFNVYDVFLGVLGLMLKYENEDISIRVNSSIGVNFNYTPTSMQSPSRTTQTNISSQIPTFNRQVRGFFITRAMITEPTTGLTLGAEISNYLGFNRNGQTKTSNAQPFYNVTLSKAFNLKNLASILKPITSK